MTTSGTTSRTRRRGLRWLAWAVLVAAVLEVIAPVATIGASGGSPGSGAGPDLLITPVGWAFSIWGVIYALAIGQAIAVLVRGARSVPRRLQIDLIVLYLGGALWILLAELDSSLATAAALLLMLIAALDAVLTVARESITPRWLGMLTRTSVGLYAGWVTAAFFLNASTALVDAGPVAADELPWQLVVLVLAVATLLALTVLTRGIVAFAAAGVWALIGIAVTGSNDGTTQVTVLAMVAILALAGTTVALHVAEHRRATPV